MFPVRLANLYGALAFGYLRSVTRSNADYVRIKHMARQGDEGNAKAEQARGFAVVFGHLGHGYLLILH